MDTTRLVRHSYASSFYLLFSSLLILIQAATHAFVPLMPVAVFYLLVACLLMYGISERKRCPLKFWLSINGLSVILFVILLLWVNMVNLMEMPLMLREFVVKFSTGYINILLLLKTVIFSCIFYTISRLLNIITDAKETGAQANVPFKPLTV